MLRHNSSRMARAIWTGTISFGLVSVPVRLYPATRRKDVRFHELDRLSGQRIRHQKVVEPAPFEPAGLAPGPAPAPPVPRIATPTDAQGAQDSAAMRLHRHNRGRRPMW